MAVYCLFWRAAHDIHNDHADWYHLEIGFSLRCYLPKSSIHTHLVHGLVQSQVWIWNCNPDLSPPWWRCLPNKRSDKVERGLFEIMLYLCAEAFWWMCLWKLLFTLAVISLYCSCSVALLSVSCLIKMFRNTLMFLPTPAVVTSWYILREGSLPTICIVCSEFLEVYRVCYCFHFPSDRNQSEKCSEQNVQSSTVSQSRFNRQVQPRGQSGNMNNWVQFYQPIYKLLRPLS